MDSATLDRIREQFFGFPRPRQTVVHEPGPLDIYSDAHCMDCTWVSEALERHDCETILASETPFFHKIALDCLNVEAFLHFFPALFKQSFGAEGHSISETMAWILGVDSDDWDADQSISLQMASRMNDQQKACMESYLLAVQERQELTPHYGTHLAAAIAFWSRQSDA